MAIERKKFTSSQDAIAKAERDASSKAYSGNERAGFHKIEDGVNVFRILPSHTPETSAYVGVRTAMLECEVDEYKDGEATGKKVIKEKKIFVATQHSSVLTVDPIELYVKYAEQIAKDENMSKADREKFLEPIMGNFAKKIQSRKPSSEMICYAMKLENGKFSEIKRLPLKLTWKKEMTTHSLKTTADEDTPKSDIFIDIDEGFLLEIEKGKDGDKVKYKIGSQQPKRTENWEQYFERTRVSDEILEKFAAMDSLEKLYVDVYSKKDWNFAIDGLKRLDAKHPEFSIFENDQFLSELDEMVQYVKEPSKEKESKPETAKTTKTESTKTVKKEEPKVEAVTPIKMKKFLREYIAENYGADQELPSNLSGEALKEWYELALKEEELPFPTEDEKEEEDEENSEDSISEDAKKALDRLRGLRSKK